MFLWASGRWLESPEGRRSKSGTVSRTVFWTVSAALGFVFAVNKNAFVDMQATTVMATMPTTTSDSDDDGGNNDDDGDCCGCGGGGGGGTGNDEYDDEVEARNDHNGDGDVDNETTAEDRTTTRTTGGTATTGTTAPTVAICKPQDRSVLRFTFIGVWSRSAFGVCG